MHTRSKTLLHKPASSLKALLTGAAVIAAVAIAGRAQATSNLCAAGECAPDLTQSPYASHDSRYSAGLQRGAGPERGLRAVELSDQDFSAFSGIGMISCTVNGTTRSDRKSVV